MFYLHLFLKTYLNQPVALMLLDQLDNLIDLRGALIDVNLYTKSVDELLRILVAAIFWKLLKSLEPLGIRLEDKSWTRIVFFMLSVPFSSSYSTHNTCPPGFAHESVLL